MKKKIYRKGGKINDNKGYLLENLNNFTPKKIIEGSQYGTNITTNKLAFPILANNKILYPNTGEYYFPESEVEEYPIIAQIGYNNYKRNKNNSYYQDWNNQAQVLNYWNDPISQVSNFQYEDESMGDYNPYQFNVNSNKSLDANASKMKVGMENMKARIAGSPNPVNAVLGGVNMAGDLTNSALSAFAKPDSKASAYAEGSQMAQSVVKPLENIPIVGQASKLISGIIGGALFARKKAIENEEQDKQFKLTEYLDRNLITAKTPSYYEQYHAKYGANPKMMEQKMIDDIYSDFDKYLKIV